MYKILFLLKKSKDESIINHFNDFIIKYLSEITGTEVKSAVVESNLLLEQKYEAYCEISTDSKDEMNRLMSSEKGKLLNKDLFDFHKHIDIITVNYGK